MSLKSHGSASIVDDSQKSFPLPPSQHGTYTKQMALAEGKDKQVKGGDVALARARQAYSLKLAHVAMLDKHQQNQVRQKLTVRGLGRDDPWLCCVHFRFPPIVP